MAAFEESFASFVGTKHCVACNSGTDALYLVFRMMGIGDGDEVITQANTFIATALGASNCGAWASAPHVGGRPPTCMSRG